MLIPDRIETSLTAKPRDSGDHSSSPTDRRLGAGKCYIEDCACEGRYDESHRGWYENGVRPEELPSELVREIAALLGYPERGPRMRAIAAGQLSWCAGATEDDWREVLHRAATKGPRRNPQDGSVREGWVRAVLTSVVGDQA